MMLMRIGPKQLKGPPILVRPTAPTAFAPAGVTADTMNVVMRPLLRFQLGRLGRGPILRVAQEERQTATVKAGGGSHIAGPGGGAIVG